MQPTLDTAASPLVVAVTLNWNRPEDTIDCLDSLAQQTYPHLGVIVVDNGSGDDSVRRIKQAHPAVTLIANDMNQGFARGMNTGVRHALAQGAEYLFILNNDTYLAPDVVDKLVRDGGGDVAAPIIYYAAAPQRVWSAGGYFDRWLLEARGNVRGEKDEGQWPKVRTVDFVPACALLVPVGVWLEVGGFDERFFMYYEDLDFCWRLHQTGRHIRVLTEAKLWHKVSVSSGGSDSPSERYWMARSSVLYFRKHASFWQRPFISIWRLGSAVRTTGRLLWHRQGQSAYAYWRGLWAGIGERP